MNEITHFHGCDIEAALYLAPSVSTAELLPVVHVMKPKASPYPLIRVGGHVDGAYLLPDDLAGIRACFSPGVNNTKPFEDELTDIYGIDCHMCDKSSDVERFATPLRQEKQTFRKLWLDTNGEPDSIDLKTWIEELSPKVEDDLMLQIDIEGAEYRNLLAVSMDILLRFRIIVLEVHDLQFILNPGVFHAVFRPLFSKLDKAFICVHAHPNNACGEFELPGTGLNLPLVHELTFLRRDRVQYSAGATPYRPMLPHPLDIAWNVRHQPPVFLAASWLDGDPQLESQVRMLEIKLDFQGRMLEENLSHKSVAQSVFKLFQDNCSSTTKSIGDTQVVRGNLIEIAKGKPFVLSSAFASTPSQGVVGHAGNFFFHTGLGVDQSITIDLTEAYPIRRITIHNRLDGCFERADLLFAVLHNYPVPTRSGALPLQTTPAFLAGQIIHCETFVPDVAARYVTIFSVAHTALHFSNIQVFAATTSP